MADRRARLPVFLHAGFHKTGTTSLQRVLAANRAAMAPLWRVELAALNPDLRQITDTARRYSLRRDPVELALFRGLAAGWLAGLTLTPGQGLLISTEDFSGHMPGARGVADYGATPDLAGAFADAVRAAFGGRADLAFVYSTRAAAEWLPSLYAQHARHAHVTASRADFLRDLAQAADLAAVVAQVRQVVAPVPVHAFALEEWAGHRLGPAAAFLRMAGMSDAALGTLAAVPMANARLPDALVDAFVALNRQGLAPDALRAEKARLSRDWPDDGAGHRITFPAVPKNG